MFKTITKVEFYGENNEINRNIENLMTIALWELFWSNVFNPLILRIAWVYHDNSKSNIENKITIPIRNKINVELFYFKTLKMGS